MRLLCLDFETKDPYIGLELGAGWAFACAYPEASLFYPIGYSYCFIDTEENTITQPQYLPLSTKSLINHDTPEWKRLDELIKSTKNIVCHNAQYDLGCLRSLGINIKHLRTYDTKVMGQLFDSTLYSYSLSALLKKYSLGTKQAGSLSDVVTRFDLLKTSKGNSLNKDTKTYGKKARDFAYSNMDLLQELDFESMAFYANHDTLGTARLFLYYYSRVGDQLSHFYSNIQKICVEIREPGITVDMAAVDHAIMTLTPVVKAYEDSIRKHLGDEVNLHSTLQLPEALARAGYDLPLTEKGNPSCSAEYIEENPNDELLQAIGEYRSLYMLLNTFSVKVKDMQQYTCPYLQAGGNHGRVFPELNLLAARTGRFSSSNPNIQNIPKRNREYAALCRAMFIPTHSTNDWFSLDWSNQEGRLQLHYAVLNGFKKSDEWLSRFKKDPKVDTHSIVAEMMGGVPRNTAKTIYLGKSFCMGRAKTAKRLGLSTEYITLSNGKKLLTSGKEATALIDKYEQAFPYLTELQKDCMRVIQNKGYIKTLGGRKSKRPPEVKGRNYDYKAISLLIQGSAADQMYKALTMAHEANISIKCIVHDEFNLEGSKKDAKIMKEIMETCIDIVVPSVAEVSQGPSWGNLSKLEDI